MTNDEPLWLLEERKKLKQEYELTAGMTAEQKEQYHIQQQIKKSQERFEKEEHEKQEKNKLQIIQLEQREKKIAAAEEKERILEQQVNKLIDNNPGIVEAFIKEMNKAFSAIDEETYIKNNKEWINDIVSDFNQKERSYHAYREKQRHPHISISVILHLFNIGGSTFRTERLIHKRQWDIKSHDRIKDDAIDLIESVLVDDKDYINEVYPGIDIKSIYDIVRLSSSSQH